MISVKVHQKVKRKRNRKIEDRYSFSVKPRFYIQNKSSKLVEIEANP